MLLQSHIGPCVPQAGSGDGSDVGSRCRVLGRRRPRLPLVPHRPNQRTSRCSHLRSGRVSTAGMGGGQAAVVPPPDAIRHA